MVLVWTGWEEQRDDGEGPDQRNGHITPSNGQSPELQAHGGLGAPPHLALRVEQADTYGV